MLSQHSELVYNFTGIVCDTNKSIFYFLNGVNHREDGPACEHICGNKFWFRNGRLHRENKPAIELSNGDKHWYFNGKLHRLNGPALEYTVEYSDGTKTKVKGWYINNENYREEEYYDKIQKMNLDK